MIEVFVDNPEDLLISDTLIDSNLVYSFEDLAAINLKLIPLIKGKWTLDKGKRTTRKYTLEDQTDVACFRYEYVLDGTKVTDFTRYIDYHDRVDGVGMTKEILEDAGNLVRLNITIRQNIVDDLRERGELLRAAAETQSEPIKSVLISIADDVDDLLIHYKTQMDDFVLSGNSDLLDAINNEADQVYIDKLNKTTLDGKTVKESIVYEIT